MWASQTITANLVQSGLIGTDMNPSCGDFADMKRSLTALGLLWETGRNSGDRALPCKPCRERYNRNLHHCEWGVQRLVSGQGWSGM
ncbi:hypothetical protein [Vreelandella olivaria]|uniref:hypothetical protein n=1 Tax=Vreelandella olivaria TaxID=390919 RepID=UPI00201F9D93|nr:hypothetical protein [Halomonas olivaria]